MKRPKCKLDGCNNLAMMKNKLKNGEWGFDRLCGTHHRLKYKMKLRPNDEYSQTGLKKLIVKPCERCGWNKSCCDLHRKINGKDGGKYVLDNVMVLCPNCHRIEHIGILNKKGILCKKK